MYVFPTFFSSVPTRCAWVLRLFSVNFGPSVLETFQRDFGDYEFVASYAEIFSPCVCFLPAPSRAVSTWYQPNNASCCCQSKLRTFMQGTNTYLYICLCAKPLTTKPTIVNGMYMFQIHVAPQPLGTVHYLPFLLVTSFSRNYYGGRGRLSAPPDPCNIEQSAERSGD